MNNSYSGDSSEQKVPVTEENKSAAGGRTENVFINSEERRNRQVEKYTHWLRMAVAVFFHFVVIGFLSLYLSFFVMIITALSADDPTDKIENISYLVENIFPMLVQTLPYVFLAAALITFINKLGGGVQKRINQAIGNSE